MKQAASPTFYCYEDLRKRTIKWLVNITQRKLTPNLANKVLENLILHDHNISPDCTSNYHQMLERIDSTLYSEMLIQKYAICDGLPVYTDSFNDSFDAITLMPVESLRWINEKSAVVNDGERISLITRALKIFYNCKLISLKPDADSVNAFNQATQGVYQDFLQQLGIKVAVIEPASCRLNLGAYRFLLGKIPPHEKAIKPQLQIEQSTFNIRRSNTKIDAIVYYYCSLLRATEKDYKEQLQAVIDSPTKLDVGSVSEFLAHLRRLLPKSDTQTIPNILEYIKVFLTKQTLVSIDSSHTLYRDLKRKPLFFALAISDRDLAVSIATYLECNDSKDDLLAAFEDVRIIQLLRLLPELTQGFINAVAKLDRWHNFAEVYLSLVKNDRTEIYNKEIFNVADFLETQDLDTLKKVIEAYANPATYKMLASVRIKLGYCVGELSSVEKIRFARIISDADIQEHIREGRITFDDLISTWELRKPRLISNTALKNGQALIRTNAQVKSALDERLIRFRLLTESKSTLIISIVSYIYTQGAHKVKKGLETFAQFPRSLQGYERLVALENYLGEDIRHLHAQLPKNSVSIYTLTLSALSYPMAIYFTTVTDDEENLERTKSLLQALSKYMDELSWLANNTPKRALKLFPGKASFHAHDVHDTVMQILNNRWSIRQFQQFLNDIRGFRNFVDFSLISNHLLFEQNHNYGGDTCYRQIALKLLSCLSVQYKIISGEVNLIALVYLVQANSLAAVIAVFENTALLSRCSFLKKGHESKRFCTPGELEPNTQQIFRILASQSNYAFFEIGFLDINEASDYARLLTEKHNTKDTKPICFKEIAIRRCITEFIEDVFDEKWRRGKLLGYNPYINRLRRYIKAHKLVVSDNTFLPKLTDVSQYQQIFTGLLELLTLDELVRTRLQAKSSGIVELYDDYSLKFTLLSRLCKGPLSQLNLAELYAEMNEPERAIKCCSNYYIGQENYIEAMLLAAKQSMELKSYADAFFYANQVRLAENKLSREIRILLKRARALAEESRLSLTDAADDEPFSLGP